MAVATPRTIPLVSVRPARPTDAALLARWRAEASVRQHQPLQQLTAAELRADLAAHRANDLGRGYGQKFQWIVTLDEEPGGWITLVANNWEHGVAELGYALSTPFQARGLMACALEQILAEVFCASPLERLEARCSVGNVASQRVLERLGFRREGTLRQYFVLEGARVDNHLYALLRGEYLAYLAHLRDG
jgi:RimJ/RimL family protein N-acetyltransferase